MVLSTAATIETSERARGLSGSYSLRRHP